MARLLSSNGRILVQFEDIHLKLSTHVYFEVCFYSMWLEYKILEKCIVMTSSLTIQKNLRNFKDYNVCQKTWCTSCDLCCRRTKNPLFRKTMLFQGGTNSTAGRNDVFPSNSGLRLSIQHCITGEGVSQLLFLQRKKVTL